MDLSELLIENIRKTFFVPSYQRGYRWTEGEVNRLLDDLSSNQKGFYCLQPIVVKVMDDGSCELIDGQQRMTTIYIILTSIRKHMPTVTSPFTIGYEIRQGSAHYLDRLDEEHAEDNIDYHYMHQAYLTVNRWLDCHATPARAASKLLEDLLGRTKVIWYEVDNDVNGVDMFERLNIGKIPLTNSELVKALFLSSSSDMSSARKAEVALIWDKMESSLRNEDMWSFIAGNRSSDYSTRMDLVLSLITSGRYKDDSYGIFFELQEVARNKTLEDLWNELVSAYQLLEDWYNDSECYHRIGYLMKEGSIQLEQLCKKVREMERSLFISFLDDEIRECVNLDVEDRYLNLSYETDSKLIQRLLLLFNVLTTLKEDGGTHRFPFSKYHGKSWSLEHIHAQQSQGLNTEEGFRIWLKDHRKALVALGDDGANGLVIKIDALLGEKRVARDVFENLRGEIVSKLSESDDVETADMHSILNLALLGHDENAALSNSVFAVKRRMIIEMDQRGDYIPPCTRNVFLKYYSLVQDKEIQFHFWSKDDKESYRKALNNVLSPYLGSKEI